MVYILNKDGKPLMPTERHGKIRRLLKSGKARVIKRCPFTVQLLYDTTDIVQELTMGVDAGSKYIGVSVTSENKEYYSGEVELRKDIVDLLSTRGESRRSRRHRKTRYRQARFLNRKKGEGWLAPSVRHKIESHMTVIDQIHRMLPINKIVVEVASFDIQKIKNPDTSGVEYQQGKQLGFWNVREYVLWRDGHVCQHCKGKSKDNILNVHHLESRKIGGDAPNNLLTLCETCHKKYHKGEIALKQKRGTSYKDAAFMGIMRWAFYEQLKKRYPNVSLTYGYLTKNTRIKAGLKKAHYVDALCITENPLVKPLGYYFYQKKVRRHNRQIHKSNPKKGKRKLNQAPYLVKGFRLFDKVLYDKQECFVFGRRTSGGFDIRKLNGEVVSRCANYKKLKLLETRKGYLTERRTQGDLQFHDAIPPMTEVTGILANV